MFKTYLMRLTIKTSLPRQHYEDTFNASAPFGASLTRLERLCVEPAKSRVSQKRPELFNCQSFGSRHFQNLDVKHQRSLRVPAGFFKG